MKLHATPLSGVLRIECEPMTDPRGWFVRKFCADNLRAAGAQFGQVRQISVSLSRKKGTLRGMHWQSEPKPEAKIVRVLRGRIFDVALDLRPASPSYKKWFGCELHAVAHNGILIPHGCAH